MTGLGQPPLRTTHLWRAPGGLWCYDLWGRHGRPVVLLPAVLLDRVMWWPAAADLRPHATVIAVDLPGHGGSTGRHRYKPEELIDDLAGLLHHVGVRQAPVVVGHASAAPLAVLFAARYPTHAVVSVDPLDGHHTAVGLARYLASMQLTALPAPYDTMVLPARDPKLLAAYRECMTVDHPSPVGMGWGWTTQPARLVVHSSAPARRQPEPGAPADPCRIVCYDVPGRFAHLTDAPRFVDDIRALL